ncbi:gliding motility lipoprotein GldH [Aureibacter tunicatorum]|uniref:Gliding motility-associated lipoprotein GldH n=1 Tax=Aureibacter tunicatorum TaxID=866807 RepID=A0AAE3XI61_9BACT|nr:gliding motility lipoprotein GldH [Aureibacter tunicatorum]MDR6238146.1 gliding motility-associated lipoprotein GldH [Aureibacter tunicatorum]BDD03179.1 gliding motility lipoprotein GldH [Aureibacter tunicatorum]
MRRFFLAFSGLLFLMLSSCDKSKIFDTNYEFPYEKWNVSNTPEFNFDIKNPEEKYNLSINVRNGIDYPYQNLYVNYQLQDSEGKVLKDTLENILLFDSKTGKPEGLGYGDVYDLEKPILNEYKFNNAGSFKVVLKQMMRVDDLEGITSVGLKVTQSGIEK